VHNIKDINAILAGIKTLSGNISERNGNELYINVNNTHFALMCRYLHRELVSPVMSLFAVDERSDAGTYAVYCVFEAAGQGKWFIVRTLTEGEPPKVKSISSDIYSALLFERAMKEQFGIMPEGCPDTRMLNLHSEVWPEGNYPLRKDFKLTKDPGKFSKYVFDKIEGEGVFEVPVGPVHAGVIGPGHFRFSVAGEPIINLEARLGFTHRGVEKLFEGKTVFDAVNLSECISGDASFGHSLAYCDAAEKILGLTVPARAAYLRGALLELERMYNHAADIGGIAVDVGFSFPNALASVIKEKILRLNEMISGSRYLKGLNIPGGLKRDITNDSLALIETELSAVMIDFEDLVKMLFSNGVFMDRVERTGILKEDVARDLGVRGVAGRASGIDRDLRKDIISIYKEVGFSSVKEDSGDALARLNVRIGEFRESRRLITEFIKKMPDGEALSSRTAAGSSGFAIGCAEIWRGPALYWLALDKAGIITRCKVTDPSVRNWQGIAFAAPGNIVPDFPLCNKSFNLSYSGNDL